MPTGVKILIGFACGALALFMIGVLTAVAIPVFLNQRAKATAEATTLRLPASVGAHQQLTDTTSSRTADQIRSMLPRGAEVGIYGTPGDPSLIVYVYPSFLPAGADAAFVAGVAQGAAHEGVPMHEVDTGRLGGFGRCGGVVGGGATHCVFADSAGAVGMVVRGEGATAVREAVAIREQVEQRRS